MVSTISGSTLTTSKNVHQTTKPYKRGCVGLVLTDGVTVSFKVIVTIMHRQESEQ
jgi:hypothetical protein